MCGHIGVAALQEPGWQKRKDWIYKALYVDTLRGFDGTGICTVPYLNSNKETTIIKKPIPGYEFIDLKRVQKHLLDMDEFRAVIGHNRKTTRGSNTTIFCHPFNHGNIFLAHNGTLDSFNGLEYHTSDSEAICKGFAEKGAEAVLPELNGAYALVWFDQEQDALFMARNSQRPLYFQTSEDGKELYWASEYWMIPNIMDNSTELDETYYDVTPGHLIKFDLNGDSFKDFESTEFKIFQSPYKGKSKGKSAANSQSTHTHKAKDRDKTSAELLRYFNLKQDDRILFRPLEFFPIPKAQVKGKDMGKIVGAVIYPDFNEGTFDRVVCHYVSRDLWDLATKKDGGHYYLGATVRAAVRSSKSMGEIDIIVNNVTEVDWETDTPIDPASDGDTSDADDLVVGPHNTAVTVDEFNKLVAGGCWHCQDKLTADDADSILWGENNRPYCWSCADYFTGEAEAGTNIIPFQF